MAKEHWYWLAAGLGFGAVNTGDLLAEYPGGAVEIAEDLGSEKLDDILTQKQAERLAETSPADFTLPIQHARSTGVQCIGYDDEEYPDALRSIHNPPVILFVQGDVSLLNGRLAIGVVGTRRPSAYGVEAAKAIGRGIALGGAVIVSGLASGLDSEAHKAALAVNGPTVACIAFGHDHCYPAANRKMMEVIGRYGAVVSEYPIGTAPEKPYFLQRNRIIAGLSHGLCVVEARRHSGTMSTVNFASEYGRDVFAVPGSIFSELSGGTNAMISEGAYVAGSATDILAAYGIELSEEDLALQEETLQQEATKAPAVAKSPWRDNTEPAVQAVQKEKAPAQKKPKADKVPEGNSLGEALRAQLGNGDGPVSASAAVDAFRAIQGQMSFDVSDVALNDAQLDKMAAAVSDSVEFSARPSQSEPEEKYKKKKTRKKTIKGEATPFSWDTVPKINKETVQDLSSPVSKTKGKQKEPQKSAPQLFSWDDVPRVDKRKEKKLSPVEDVPAKNPRKKRNVLLSKLFETSGVEKQKEEPKQDVVDKEPENDENAVVVKENIVKTTNNIEKPKAKQEDQPKQKEKKKEIKPEKSDPPKMVGVPLQKPAKAKEKVQSAPAEQKEYAHGFADTAYPKPISETNNLGIDATMQERLKTIKETQRTIASAPLAPAQKRRVKMADVKENNASSTQPAKKESAIPFASAMGATKPKDVSGSKSELSDVAKRALSQLKAQPVDLQSICEKSELSVAEAMAALTELELAGLSRQLPGRRFVIMQ